MVGLLPTEYQRFPWHRQPMEVGPGILNIKYTLGQSTEFWLYRSPRSHHNTPVFFCDSGQSTPDLYNPHVVGVPLWHPREARKKQGLGMTEPRCG